MLRSRLFEEAVIGLWTEGWIHGEMHLGIGEEGIAAGVVAHLRDGDAMALDHRGTPPLLMRGVDPVLLFREFLGRPDGLCRGLGGHMHLFSPELLAASSGIVGASGPAAVGFALAGRRLRPGSVAVAFFGEGAFNQGVLMEALNLAVVWRLPVLFVCKDSGLSIATTGSSVTGGKILERARSFGLPASVADGADARAVWIQAGSAIERARKGGGPSFLLAPCVHFEGHMLSDPLIRAGKRPLKEMGRSAGPLLAAAVKGGGAGIRERITCVADVLALVHRIRRDVSNRKMDPLVGIRYDLKEWKEEVDETERKVREEIFLSLERALSGPGGEAEG